MIRGDLTDKQTSNWKWLLFENQGDFVFRDAAQDRKIADYEFSWGMVLEDLNLDGREDLIVAENYIGLPLHKPPFLSNGGDAGFLKVKLPNQVSSIAATVEVTLRDGSIRTKPFVSGEGLLSDPSHVLIFGLAALKATQVSVTFIDGSRQSREGQWRNDTVVF